MNVVLGNELGQLVLPIVVRLKGSSSILNPAAKVAKPYEVGVRDLLSVAVLVCTPYCMLYFRPLFNYVQKDLTLVVRNKSEIRRLSDTLGEN